MSYSKANALYTEMQAISGLKEGDHVKVLRKAQTDEMGWDNSWEYRMDKAVGNTYQIRSISGPCGIQLTGIDMSFPFFVLEKVEPPYTPYTLTLGTLEEFETLKSIMHLHNKVSESSFFTLDWTPAPSKVREYMKTQFAAMDEHHQGWSKYQK